MSNEKTSIFFSKNVNRPTRERLIHLSGVPLTGKAPKKEDYRYVIEQVSYKLVSWKADHLSFAGRVTLAKKCFRSYSHIYPMMTSIIPESCVDEILQRIQRKFIWGEMNNERKYHAVGWDKVVKLKELGGLGLRRLDIMNKACLYSKVGLETSDRY